MRLPFTVDAFLDVFAAYNQRLWVVALGLWLVSAYAVFVLATSRSSNPRFVSALLAVHWAWSGLAYHAGYFSSINRAAWIFSGLFLAQAGLLIWHGLVRQQLRIRHDPSFWRVCSLTLLAYALVYPALGYLEGLSFPRMPTFGVPCPTTILTLGFMLSMDEFLPLSVMVVPVVWSIIGGSAAFLLGVPADWMLFVAGGLLVIYRFVPSGSRMVTTVPPD